MNQAETVTIYYDASCRLCSAEILNLKRYDAENRMTLVDCSAADFDTRPFAEIPITQDDMMSNLHVRSNQGHWYIGVQAFEVMYRMAGFNKIASLWGSPIIKPLANRLYPWVVRNRYYLSKLGAPQLIELWGWFAARSADKRSRQCRNGQCSTTTNASK